MSRSAVLQVRLSESEKLEVRRLAEAEGLSLTAFTRSRLLGHTGEPRASENLIARVIGDLQELLPGLVREVVEHDLPGVVEAALGEHPAPVTAPLYVPPKPYSRDCFDADNHGNGKCQTCGGSFY